MDRGDVPPNAGTRQTRDAATRQTRGGGGRAAVRPLLAALLAALTTACSTGSTSPDRTLGPPESALDGSVAASPTVEPGTDDERPALDRRITVAPSASATPPPSGTPTGAVPAGSRGTTPGQGTRPSQLTGQGFVDTRLENALPGTPGWQAARSGRRVRIEGYAHAMSVTAGEPVRLFVSSSGTTFRVQMLRIGWYRGVGARQVWMSVPVRGGLQAAARHDPVTRMITAPWRVSATIPTDGLVAGDYVLKLLGSDGASSFVPLIVREPRTAGALLMLNSTLTWLAYNPWGGANSYKASGGGDSDSDEGDDEGYAGRSVVSSFDRPFARGSGTGGLFDEEYQLVLTAERAGLKLNYAAEADLHGTPEVLDGSYGVAVLGHSEYWSRPMRAALTAARDSGVNLAFFGANDVFRRIRLTASPNGPARQMINYKDGAEDPDKSADSTADWPKAPFADPEISLVGTQYRCAKARADLVISDPDGWVFRGLKLTRGQKLPDMVGEEFDRVVPALKVPRPIQIMAHSPVSCYGYPEYADLTWYSDRSGAGVFSAGTLDWNGGLTSGDALTRTVVTTVTERVMQAVAQPLAGDTLPAADNVDRHYNASGVPLDLSGKPITLPKRR